MIFVYDGKKILNKHRGFLFDQVTTMEKKKCRIWETVGDEFGK